MQLINDGEDNEQVKSAEYLINVYRYSSAIVWSSLQYADNSISQRALPVDLNLSVLPILRGRCFQVVIGKTSSTILHTQRFCFTISHPIVFAGHKLRIFQEETHTHTA